MKISNISAQFILTKINIIYCLIVMLALSVIRCSIVIFQTKSERGQVKKIKEENIKILRTSIISYINNNKKFSILKKRNLQELIELSIPSVIKKLKINNNNLKIILQNKKDDIYSCIEEIYNRYFK